ncbi:MAG: radical SAM protein [Treponema sp.]|nr:radical SAM protein [Treponema sp.]
MSNNLYENCLQCPRKCAVDRTQKKGFCRETEALRIATACLHFGEEPLITVYSGSGTIFFTGCTLRCSFCQNYQISQQGIGREVSQEEFTMMCQKLQEKGAENINLITGSHHIPIIAQYIRHAKENGVSIPFAWNSSAYESTESLELLKGLIDIWLPDLKTLNPLMSKELFDAEDYPSAAKKAIRWMISNSPMHIIKVKKHGEAKEKMMSGVIIRHLFLPGRITDTQITLDWLKKFADNRACISLMSQYTPVPFSTETNAAQITAFQNRLVNTEEDEQLRNMIEEYDFDYLFYQDLSDDTSWLPDFNRTQPFSNALATPIWHWKEGFI